MRRNLLILIGVLMLACGPLVFGRSDTAPGTGGTVRALADAEPSADQLVDRFLGALAGKDPDALHRLRVTEAEYREIVMPGTVPEGQPLKRPSKEFADFAWGLIDTKSRYYEQSLLQEYGGRRLRLKATAYEKGEKRFAGYTAREQLRLTLEDETSGTEVRLATGSIVGVAGRYKFASFVRD